MLICVFKPVIFTGIQILKRELFYKSSSAKRVINRWFVVYFEFHETLYSATIWPFRRCYPLIWLVPSTTMR